MVPELDTPRAQRAEPALDLRQRGVVVRLEQRGVSFDTPCTYRGVLSGASRNVSECPLTKTCRLGLCELIPVREARATEVARLHPGARLMGGRDVVVVRAVVHHRLPVDGLEPFHRAQRLHPPVPPVEQRVEVPARVAQIGLERGRIGGPRGEHDPRVRLDPGLDEAELRPIQRVVVRLGPPGHVLERAVAAVRPAVVGAHEPRRVAVVAAHHPVATVAAHVEEGVQPSLAVAGQDDGVLAHVGVEEVVGRGHQALVPDHEPGAPEDPLHLVVVDGLLAEDAARDFSGRGVDDGVLRCRTHGALPEGDYRPALVLDPSYPSDRLAYMLSDSGAELVITDTKNHPIVAQMAGGGRTSSTWIIWTTPRLDREPGSAHITVALQIREHRRPRGRALAVSPAMAASVGSPPPPAPA